MKLARSSQKESSNNQQPTKDKNIKIKLSQRNHNKDYSRLGALFTEEAPSQQVDLSERTLGTNRIETD